MGRIRDGWRRLGRAWAHAFAVGAEPPLEEADRLLLDRLAAAIRRRRMQAAAILFLESVKPLGFLGSQALVFLRPFATAVLRSPQDYDRLTRLLERRDGIEALLERLEAPEAAQREEEAGERREDPSR